MQPCRSLPVQHLIDEHGREGKVIDWLDEITADCPKKMGTA
jgi:hypothetical protein